MSLTQPKGFATEPFADHFSEGDVFTLKGARIVKTGNFQYGDDRMVILQIEVSPGEIKDFSIWGKYLVSQVEDAEPSDFNKRYKLITAPLSTAKTPRPTKQLVPEDSSDIPF